MTNNVKDNVKKRLTCTICKRRMTVINPVYTGKYVCPLCKVREEKKRKEASRQARREMVLENLWWTRD